MISRVWRQPAVLRQNQVWTRAGLRLALALWGMGLATAWAISVNWVELSHNADGQFWIETQGMITKGAYKYAWTKLVLTTPLETVTHDKVGMMMTHWVVDCAKQTAGTDQVVTYDPHGKLLQQTPSAPTLTAHAPGTGGNAVIASVCTSP